MIKRLEKAEFSTRFSYLSVIRAETRLQNTTPAAQVPQLSTLVQVSKSPQQQMNIFIPPQMQICDRHAPTISSITERDIHRTPRFYYRGHEISLATLCFIQVEAA